MDQKLLTATIQKISRGLQGLRLYPANHPALRQQLSDLGATLGQLHCHKAELEMGILEGTLFFEDRLFTTTSPTDMEVLRAIEGLGVEKVKILRGVTEEELVAFLILLSKGNPGRLNPKALFFEAEITHLVPVCQEEDLDEELVIDPRQVFAQALEVTERIFTDVRMGRIPSTSEVRQAVRGMVTLTLADPQALLALSMLKDYDNYTFTHSINVSVIALVVGRACGLTEDQLLSLGLGGLLHDLGKLRVDHAILTKPAPLGPSEFEAMMRHPRDGADILIAMQDVPPEAVEVVLGHHLRFDRSGYPGDAQDRRFSPMVDMASIADAYDAMTTLRPYQRPLTPRRAIEKMRQVAGKHFHPEYLEKFIGALGDYPMGSLVRLDSNQIGLVTRVATPEEDAIQLKILFDEEGQKLPEPTRLDLRGKEAGRIVGEIDPELRGIEVANLL